MADKTDNVVQMKGLLRLSVSVSHFLNRSGARGKQDNRRLELPSNSCTPGNVIISRNFISLDTNV